jgi:hypothetical protein
VLVLQDRTDESGDAVAVGEDLDANAREAVRRRRDTALRDAPFEWALVDFASGSARDDYLPHPAHQPMAELISRSAQQVVVFDVDGWGAAYRAIADEPITRGDRSSPQERRRLRSPARKGIVAARESDGGQ